MPGDTGGEQMHRLVRGGSALVVVGFLLAGAGCTSTGAAPPAAQAAVDVVAGVSAADLISLSPDSGAVDVHPGEPVTVTASEGTLTNVVLTDSKGRQIAGSLDASGSTWTATGDLKVAEHYRVSATGVDAGGRPVQRSGYFATVAPRKVLETSISPLDGQQVGVGMPVVVRFSEPVRDRAAVESALTVTTSKPVEGSWSWLSDEEIHFRPREFWPAYTDVTVRVRLKGVSAGRGVWGMKNRTVRFRIRASMVSVVDVDRLTLTVHRDGRKARVIPVSTGKAGFLTRNGIKVVLEKHTLKIMDARTIGISPGDPEYYRLEVPYALRVTWSGEFVHSAPWSVRSQGRENVSHGCVGMSPSNAIWLFKQSSVGDIVKVVGSPRNLEPGNGYTDWNVDWADWAAGSALAG